MILKVKESSEVVTPKLEKRIRKACRTYSPDGHLIIGSPVKVKKGEIRFNLFIPKDETLPDIYVVAKGDDIIEARYACVYRPENPFKSLSWLMDELLRQHEAGEFKYAG